MKGGALEVRDSCCEARDFEAPARALTSGTTRAEQARVTDDSVKQRRLLDTRIERWTADAKKLVEAGKETAALDLYRLAADELPGAPWLQHRTAELARKLRKHDVAIVYFRRAATAFQIADFSKRAVAPLRTAWTLSIDGLPGTSALLVELALELISLHRRLGFAADATVTLERTNSALRTRGFSEIAASALDATQQEPASSRLSAPPASAPPSSGPGRGGKSSSPPASEVAPRGPATTAEGAQGSRNRALARLLGRR
jgi:hypothetical protein